MRCRGHSRTGPSAGALVGRHSPGYLKSPRRSTWLTPWAPGAMHGHLLACPLILNHEPTLRGTRNAHDEGAVVVAGARRSCGGCVQEPGQLGSYDRYERSETLVHLGVHLGILPDVRAVGVAEHAVIGHVVLARGSAASMMHRFTRRSPARWYRFGPAMSTPTMNVAFPCVGAGRIAVSRHHQPLPAAGLSLTLQHPLTTMRAPLSTIDQRWRCRPSGGSAASRARGSC